MAPSYVLDLAMLLPPLLLFSVLPLPVLTFPSSVLLRCHDCCVLLSAMPPSNNSPVTLNYAGNSLVSHGYNHFVFVSNINLNHMDVTKAAKHAISDILK